MGSDDDEEFVAFVAGRSHALLRTAYLITGDLGRAEDLLQTALLKTYLARGRIRELDAMEGYVRRVIANTAVSWWRRRSFREVTVGECPSPGEASDDHAAGYVEADQMRRLLLTLPVRQRAVLVLRFYEDLTETQVAEILGVTRGTVARYAGRGLDALRARIRDGALR